jgi:hypothetical protein
MGAANTPPPEEDDPKALKFETTLRGGEAGVVLNSGDWGVGGAPGSPRRGGSLPPGV